MSEQIFDNSLVNLHCHSYFCGHGTGEISEYAEAAVGFGFKVLGISEHCPLPDSRFGRTRMPFDEFDHYVSDCRKTQKDYAEKLIMFCGAECDWDLRYKSYYKDVILGEKALDYIGLSVHFLQDENDEDMLIGSSWGHNDPRLLTQYADMYIQGIQSGLYKFGCHPDIVGAMHERWDDQMKACSKAILEAAKDCDFPLEINSLGISRRLVADPDGPRHGYPMRKFWELAKDIGVKTIVNSDSHHPEDLRGVGRNDAEAFAKDLGIELVQIVVDGSGFVLK